MNKKRSKGTTTICGPPLECFVVARITPQTKTIVGRYMSMADAKADLPNKRMADGAKYLPLTEEEFTTLYKRLRTVAPPLEKQGLEEIRMPKERREVIQGIRYMKGNPGKRCDGRAKKNASNMVPRSKGKPEDPKAVALCNKHRKNYGRVAIRAANLMDNLFEKEARCLPEESAKEKDEKAAFLESAKASTASKISSARPLFESLPEDDLKSCEINKKDARRATETTVKEMKEMHAKFARTTCLPGSRDVIRAQLDSILEDFGSVEGTREKSTPGSGRSPEVEGKCAGKEDCFFVVLVTRKEKATRWSFTKKVLGGGFKTRKEAEKSAYELGKGYIGNQKVAVIPMAADEYEKEGWMTIAKERAKWK